MKELLDATANRTRFGVAMMLVLVGVGDAIGFAAAASGNTGVGLGVGFATFVAAAYAVYSSLRLSHSRMVVLDEFSAGLSSAILDGDPTSAILRRTQEILESDATWLISVDEGTVSTIEFDGLQVTPGLAQSSDLDIVESFNADHAPFLQLQLGADDQGYRRVRQVLAAPLPVPTGGDVFLVVGRRHRWGAFRPTEIALFTRITMHAGVAIQNVRLVARLRAESASNLHQADHDALTGLANRKRFRTEVQTALRKGRAPAILLIDLDRFKVVNDTLGHHNGDLLLAEAAERMRRAVGPKVVLARLGGDEFGAMIDASVGTTAVVAVATRLRDEMRRPFQLGPVQVDVGASVGIALAVRGSEDVGDLLRQADVAMYAAKTDRTGVEVYRNALDQHSTEQLELVPRLRSAIERRELTLYFQPQLDLRTGRIIGAETLIRWPVAGVGFIAPDDFLPIAEQTDLIRPLTRFVIGEAIAQCARWRAAGHDIRVSVNLSARNLLEPDLAAHIVEMVIQAGLPRNALRVELTETALVTRADESARALQSLRSQGIGVALDDFGTGHSSLAHLTMLPVDEVKIDKSFVLQLGTDPIAERVVSAIVELGNNLGLDVVAEGVETSAHAEALMEMGCANGQGYFFARPMTPGDFETWLAEHRRWTGGPNDDAGTRAIGSGSAFVDAAPRPGGCAHRRVRDADGSSMRGESIRVLRGHAHGHTRPRGRVVRRRDRRGRPGGGDRHDAGQRDPALEQRRRGDVRLVGRRGDRCQRERPPRPPLGTWRCRRQPRGKLLAAGELECEFLCRRRDGSTLPVSVVNMPVRDDAGGFVAIVGVRSGYHRPHGRPAVPGRHPGADLVVERCSVLRHG